MVQIFLTAARRLLPVFLLALGAAAHAQYVPVAQPAFGPAQLGIVINDDEPNSVAVGELYRKARAIPVRNVVHVHIPGKPRKLDLAQFRQLKETIDAQLGPAVQAVLMVWTAPYAVECNSLTGAYTFGYDADLCHDTCSVAKPSPYFNSMSRRPFTDFGMRLSMQIPTESLGEAQALIARGIASASAQGPASAYYLTTSQGARNSRAPFFPPPGRILARKFALKRLQADVLEGASDVMIYETGMAKVDKLETLKFLPGALADHLTSFGGDLLGEGQMSSLRWLEAGATASYGTVTEPCNHWQKFPQPSILLRHYLQGATALEAYWRSVAWPSQGVFIGEPLAAPYRR
ncbi:MAG: TIGR03790 family protein [Pseudomonadota bacterium]